MDISVATFHQWRQQLLPLHSTSSYMLDFKRKWGEEWNRGRSLNMSEEAKEKAGGGKAAHRKKKGKKVWERKSFLCLGVFPFLICCCLSSANDVLCVCMGSRRLLDEVRLMGEVDEPITKWLKVCLTMFLLVFNRFFFALSFIPTESWFISTFQMCKYSLYTWLFFC